MAHGMFITEAPMDRGARLRFYRLIPSVEDAQKLPLDRCHGRAASTHTCKTGQNCLAVDHATGPNFPSIAMQPPKIAHDRAFASLEVMKSRRASSDRIETCRPPDLYNRRPDALGRYGTACMPIRDGGGKRTVRSSLMIVRTQRAQRRLRACCERVAV